MMKIFGRLVGFYQKRKILSVFLIVLILSGGYYWYKSASGTATQVSYIFGTAQKGTIIATISGTGQVAALEEANINPKTSGPLIALPVQAGQIVTSGQVIGRIDPADAQQAVVDAQKALDQANVDLEKMKGIDTSLGTLRGIKQKAQDTLSQAYEDGFNTVTNAFLNLPTTMTGLQGILFNFNLSKNSQNIDFYSDSAAQYNGAAPQYKASASNSYDAARTAYEKNFNDYKTTNRDSSTTQIETLISETYDTIGKISQAIKDTINLIQLYQDEFTKHNLNIDPISGTQLSSLSSYANTTNGYLSSLLSVETTIETNKDSLITTDYTIADQVSLVADKQTALDNAKKNLSYCYIRSPFAGVISEVDVKNGDSISTGTTVAKIVTKDTIAQITLNEVDAAKAKIGQKAIITFDAIPDLTLTGQISGIDTVGAVSQGVVSYSIKITFDSQDERVKPGMSVSASIQTDVRQDVLYVPSSAVKKQNGASYVQILVNNAVQKVTVQTGLSDGSNTEITSGIQEGQEVITKTVTGTVTTTSTSNPNSNSIRIPGLTGGVGGGGFRGN